MNCAVGPVNKDIRGPDHVSFGDGQLEISFHRTVKVSDNQIASDMPPDLGAFPVYPASCFGKVPSAVRKKGGVFIPMHDKEAMSLHFKATKPFAIVIYVKGVNAISGAPRDEKPIDTYARILKLPYQDYLVVPPQKWLDGIAVSPGLVRQLVAVPSGSRYSIAAQLKSASQGVSELVFEVIPSIGSVPRLINPKAFSFTVMTLTGKKMGFSVPEDTGVRDLKCMIQDREGIPPDQQRLLFEGIEIDHGILMRYGLREGSVLQLVLRLRGGGYGPFNILPKFTMSLAPGGYIRQKIIKDEYAPDTWDLDRSVVLNVDIVNATSFQHITGYSSPPDSQDAAAWSKKLLPYSKDDSSTERAPLNEEGNNKWKTIKSISELDGSNETSPAISSVEVDTISPRKFSPFTELLARARALEAESDLFDPNIVRSPQKEKEVQKLRQDVPEGRLYPSQIADVVGQKGLDRHRSDKRKSKKDCGVM